MGATNETTGRPAGLDALPPERIVELDVREDLRAGREPFSRIMAAQRSLPDGGVLRLRAIFEPVPLYAVLEAQGLGHWAERRAADDWVVWFYPAADGRPAATASDADDVADGAAAMDGAAALDGPAEGDVVVLDVRGLEPPEPMVRTLERLETLAAGATLLQINERVPQFLLPQLRARGFAYEIQREAAGPVRVFIRRVAS